MYFTAWVVITCLQNQVTRSGCRKHDHELVCARLNQSSLINWMIDWIVFYAISAIFMPCNSWEKLNKAEYSLCITMFKVGFRSKAGLTRYSFLYLLISVSLSLCLHVCISFRLTEMRGDVSQPHLVSVLLKMAISRFTAIFILLTFLIT